MAQPRGRPRKLTPEQVEAAAVDRRNGMSWQKLRDKYNCAINTIRTALAEYSDEFAPVMPKCPQLEAQVTTAHSEIEKIKKVLREQLNLHV
jgi:transposase